MGCRFSRTNDADLEIDSDSTNVTAETANQSLIETTEYLVNSQSVLTSNIPEALNPTIVSDEGSVKETTASTDYMKNTCSSVHWNTPIRDRIKLRPKKNLPPKFLEGCSEFFSVDSYLYASLFKFHNLSKRAFTFIEFPKRVVDMN
ncbi:hypothetical protein X798_03659 [Onchocerca flexuosa]|uniref:Uncharacterized protein n=1 Tax=Onchocerca flexuosa TaxID=387005 RepID=A0A238BXG9_9BILA|nr:hypothetical protein X798_03659 [Onchocerca flexuosa]